jgi:hypothetical protein
MVSHWTKVLQGGIDRGRPLENDSSGHHVRTPRVVTGTEGIESITQNSSIIDSKVKTWNIVEESPRVESRHLLASPFRCPYYLSG